MVIKSNSQERVQYYTTYGVFKPITKSLTNFQRVHPKMSQLVVFKLAALKYREYEGLVGAMRWTDYEGLHRCIEAKC